jgi:hypothetical protein
MSFGFNASDIRRVAWTAAFAFLGTFGTLAYGLGEFRNFDEAKAAVLALLPAALAAAASAIKNGILADSSSIK